MARKKSPDDIEVLEAEATAEEDGESILGRVRRAIRPDAEPKPKKKAPAPPRGHPNEEEVGELVMLANLPIAMVAPRDAFTPWEAQRLTQALHAYVQTSESSRRFLYAIAQKSALLALVNVGFMVALPRLIRHGLLPPSLAPYLVGMCDASQLADAAGFAPPEAQPQEPVYGPMPERPSPNGAQYVPAQGF